MADLKTNYVDDVLDTTKNQLRKYQQIQNDDGTVSFVDVTEYTQVGTSFGAKDINDTNAAINDVNGKLIQIEKISFAKNASVTTQNSKIATMYTATQRCIVIISAVQQIANVSPKETIIYHSNHSSYIRNVGLTTATLCCHLETGESVELYASANTAGINYFIAKGIAIKL
jgi:hypothetical protein